MIRKAWTNGSLRLSRQSTISEGSKASRQAMSFAQSGSRKYGNSKAEYSELIRIVGPREAPAFSTQNCRERSCTSQTQREARAGLFLDVQPRVLRPGGCFRLGGGGCGAGSRSPDAYSCPRRRARQSGGERPRGKNQRSSTGQVGREKPLGSLFHNGFAHGRNKTFLLVVSLQVNDVHWAGISLAHMYIGISPGALFLKEAACLSQECKRRMWERGVQPSCGTAGMWNGRTVVGLQAAHGPSESPPFPASLRAWQQPGHIPLSPYSVVLTMS